MANINIFSRTKILFMLLFFITALKGQAQKIIKEGVFALEFCDPDIVDLCGVNIHPKSKIPQLLELKDFYNKKVYDSIYVDPLRSHDSDELSVLLFYDKIENITPDTLRVRAPKKYTRKLNGHLKRYGYKRKFDGYFKYLIYKIKMECTIAPSKFTIVPNYYLKGTGFYTEYFSKRLYVNKILSIEATEFHIKEIKLIRKDRNNW